MGLPQQPVTLSAEQVAELNRKLSEMRHAINNRLALLVAAAEVVRLRPETMDKVGPTFSDQPHKITEDIKQFTGHLEKTLGITRD